jgi:glycosyltransferase involved in cell wall biosynthesis
LGETCNWEDKKNIITYCGRLMSTKGADVLIEAFSKLMKDKDYCSYPLALHIIGDGDLKTNLMNLCKENGIEKFVVFHGNIPNEQARKIIRKAKIHVVPSTYEPYGLTAIEALAEGTCVIASKVGGLIEFLSDGDNALLVPPADPNILADKIKYLINDKEGNQLAMKLAKNGYQYASTQTWENIALKTYEIYQYLIKKRVNNLD